MPVTVATPLKPLEGEIHVTLTTGAAGSCRIHSTRPLLAQRLLIGCTPQSAATRVGLTYSLCRNAQRAACEAATAAALGVTHTPAHTRLSILAELAREHVWQLLAADGVVPPAPTPLIRIRQAGEDAGRLADTLSGILNDSLLGEPAAVWLERDTDGLLRWARAGKTRTARALAQDLAEPLPTATQTPLLPPLWDWTRADIERLASQALDAPAFCQQPLWQGTPAETGAIARLAGAEPVSCWLTARGRDPVVRRLARLAELARLPEWLRGEAPQMQRAWHLGEGTGVAGVETARGLLFHVVRLRDGLVTDYRILAPTEWNFHPRGPLAEAMQALAWDEVTIARVERLIRSLDPCVAFRVEVAQDA
ncbi:MAG: nickel-dependent hydrogenase large subunit [Thiobacillaceae bacterium]